jgi:hypothetical protein
MKKKIICKLVPGEPHKRACNGNVVANISAFVIYQSFQKYVMVVIVWMPCKG